MNERFVNIVFFVATIFVIYAVFDTRFSGTAKNVETFLDAPLAPEPQKNVVKSITGKEFNENNNSFIERKIAGILSSFAETPQGKEFMKNMVYNKHIPNSDGVPFKDILLPFNIAEYKIINYGKKQTPKCGDKIKVQELINKKSYEYILGENKIDNGLDGLIQIMGEGEIREVRLKNNKNYQLLLEKISPNLNKVSLNYSQNIDTPKVSCGTNVFANIEIKDYNNNLIYSYYKKYNRPLILTLNNNNLPNYILNKIIDNGFYNNSSFILNKAEAENLLKMLKIYFQLPKSDIYSFEIITFEYEFAKPKLNIN